MHNILRSHRLHSFTQELPFTELFGSSKRRAARSRQTRYPPLARPIPAEGAPSSVWRRSPSTVQARPPRLCSAPKRVLSWHGSVFRRPRSSQIFHVPARKTPLCDDLCNGLVVRVFRQSQGLEQGNIDVLWADVRRSEQLKPCLKGLASSWVPPRCLFGRRERVTTRQLGCRRRGSVVTQA